MRLSIRVRSELVRQGLEDLGKEVPNVGRRRLRTILERAKRIMEEYPAERPGQKYKRTGRFFRGWRIEQISGSKGYTLKNVAMFRGNAYPQYVVGDAYGTSQAWMHKGRWPNFRDVTEKELEALPEELGDEIVMVARRIGFEAE